MKSPSCSVSLDDIPRRYGAQFFVPALCRFVVQCQQPGISHVELEKQIISLFVPLSRVPIYHRIKYTEEERHAAYRVMNTFIVVDSIHAEPEHRDKRNKTDPGRFDTGLVDIGNATTLGVEGTL